MKKSIPKHSVVIESACIFILYMVFVFAMVSKVSAASFDNWHQRYHPNLTDKTLNGIDYGYDTFVAVGEAGEIYTSPDGGKWTKQVSGTTNSLNAIIYGNNNS